MSQIGMMHVKDAKQLTEINKTLPIWEDSTPRWLLKILEAKGIENTTFRINKVKSINKILVDGYEYDPIIQDNVEYHHQPIEIELSALETLVKVPSKIYDVMNHPHDQMGYQIELTIQNIYEHKEKYFINNLDTGLISFCTKNNRIQEYNTVINPYILDNLLSLVWIKPTFYLMHPTSLSDFCKSCNDKGLNTGCMELFGYQFVTWRGLPIITSDKIPFSKSGTFVFLIRTGVEDSGVIQLYNIAPTKSGHQGVFIETAMTDHLGNVTSRISTYTNIAVLSNESIACAKITC